MRGVPPQMSGDVVPQQQRMGLFGAVGDLFPHLWPVPTHEVPSGQRRLVGLDVVRSLAFGRRLQPCIIILQCDVLETSPQRVIVNILAFHTHRRGYTTTTASVQENKLMIGFVLWLHHHCMCSGKRVGDRGFVLWLHHHCMCSGKM
jgi:hypothetical protein